MATAFEITAAQEMIARVRVARRGLRGGGVSCTAKGSTALGVISLEGVLVTAMAEPTARRDKAPQGSEQPERASSLIASTRSSAASTPAVASLSRASTSTSVTLGRDLSFIPAM